MLIRLVTSLVFFASIAAKAQYRNDNVSFKTVYPSELCNALAANAGYLLLDVRSPGEHHDTSRASNLNIGHLKGAINIDVGELDKRLSEIRSYSNKPIFVYCSHSQRSRRASKLLADSGFTNVFNINGGMTAVYYTNTWETGCMRQMLETSNAYATISAMDLCNKLSQANKPFVLDVRSDSAFRHISGNARMDALGTIKGSVNIPLADLEQQLDKIPRDKEIIVTELSSGDAAKAAVLLTSKGYNKVSVLIEGIGRLLSAYDQELNSCKKDWFIDAAPYDIMSVTSFGHFTQAKRSYVLLDARSPEEFANTHKDSWRNIGRLQNSINIPGAAIEGSETKLNDAKNKQVFIYGFGSGDADTYKLGNYLVQHGFTHVHVLATGIFDIRWSAANKQGMAFLKDLVTDVPEINW